MTSAHERWTQRILGGAGARPVGHQAPDEEVADGPQIPTQSPVPPPASAPRITPWWATGRPHLTGDDPVPAVPVDDGQEDDVDEHQDHEEEGEPVSKESAPPAVETAAEQGEEPKRTGVRNVLEGATEDPNMRVIMFNLSAGGVGYGLGLVDILGRFLPAAENGAVGMLSLFTAAGGAWAAWRCTRPHGVQRILPIPPLSRTVIACGAAAIGRESAPVPVDWLNARGERWGLGADAVSLLLTAGVMCGGLWWFIDRRTRHWHWTARWLFRIPLASALLATGLYAPGTT